MKRVSALAAALGAVLTAGAALNAQAPTAAAPAPANVKVAVIAFQQAVMATNEFQRDIGDVQKKFEPQSSQLKQLGTEVDTLTKQLQAQGSNLSDAERANRAKTIDDKKKQAQRLAEDAQNDYQAAVQETFGRVATKVGDLLMATPSSRASRWCSMDRRTRSRRRWCCMSRRTRILPRRSWTPTTPSPACPRLRRRLLQLRRHKLGRQPERLRPSKPGAICPDAAGEPLPVFCHIGICAF